MGHWITNLESIAKLESDVKNAECALKVAKDTGGNVKQAQSMLSIAKYKLADVKNTYRQIEQDNNGRISIGEPLSTPYKSAEDIAKDGIVGIYRQGAGDGPASSFKDGGPT